MSTKIKAPDWLSDRANEIFKEVVATLGDKLAPTDAFAVADYAQACADVEAWVVLTRFEGEILLSDRGNKYVNPLYNNLMARRKDVERLRGELGLSPKARKVGLGTTLKSGLKSAMNR